MSTFSIDEVRDSFTADVGLFLMRIERGAQEALAAPVLEPEAVRAGLASAFAALGDLGHAIYGTSALVGAESLHESARAIEELARAGQEAAARMEEAAARARAIADACAGGVLAMRRMLERELARRGDEAADLARRWIASVAHLHADPAVAGGSVDAGWDAVDTRATAVGPAFRVPSPAIGVAAPAAPVGVDGDERDGDDGDDGDEPVSEPTANEVFEFAASAPELDIAGPAFEAGPESVFHLDEPSDGFGGELIEIFRTEGQENALALDAALAQLRADPGDMSALASLERLYHTMKGAASIVGLDEVSRAAADIQERLEAQLERGAPATADAIGALVADTNAMLRRAGLPALTPVAAPVPAPAATAHRFFLEEVQELQREAQGLIEELGSSSAETSLRARIELAVLFHRLKGSALLVGEMRVGGEADKMQALLEPEGSASTAPEELAPATLSALTRIATMLGTDAPASMAVPAPAPASLAPVREPVTITSEPELWDAFSQESNELIESLERECLSLEESAQPRQLLEKTMNILHTLKGVLNTVGVGPTARELHRVEDFLETLMKAPILPPMRSVANLLLKVKADVQKSLNDARQGYVETSMARLEARIAAVMVAGRGRADGAAAVRRDQGGQTGGASIHSIADARSRHGASSLVSAPLSEAAAEMAGRKVIRVGTERLDALMNLAGELVVSRSRLLDRVGTLRHLQRELGRGSVLLGDAVGEFRERYEYLNIDGRGEIALRERGPEESLDQGWESFGELELDRYEDVHVLSRRLAEIVSDVTELSGQLSRNLATFNDDSQAFDAIVSGIQSEVSRARMVPLELLFTRLRLPVRDAATRDQKEVRVVTQGAEVSIDKTIADGLFAPMLHLVRNAVGHGIESSAARQALGKSPVGTITLSARQQSGQIVLEVMDDGAGLDLEALRARGVVLGVLAEDTPLDDGAVKDLVFVPGLSTRAQAGAVSGRGVGCDVVRRAVERMNGTIVVETEHGRGARFVITLPVTLAISKALLVRASGRTYALPLHFAERIIDATGQPIVESAGARRVKVDDSFINITSLEQHLGGAATGGNGPILLVRIGDQREAIQVDTVIGQEEIVVKSLGDILAGHPLFAGVTMRGSGELVLIVDIPGLIEARTRRRARVAAPAAPVRVRPGGGEAAPAARGQSRQRVLFVDDSLSVRKYAELTFAALGVEVTVAVDGVDALARLRDEHFDMVFTDLEMPRMHGFELIRELRFVPAYRDLPIIVVTSRSGQKHKQQAKALGASDYLTKPFSAEVLAETMRRFAAGEAQPAEERTP